MDIIIGAGATGLAYAAMSGRECLILEADSEIGGYCKTVKQDGFVWDYSGHFFHFVDKNLKDFIYNPMDMSTVLTCNKNTQIYYKGSYVDFPFQKNIHQLPDRQEFLDCLYDLFFKKDIPKGDSFKAMLYEKFGRGIAEKFLIPYNEKLYACDLDSLDREAMGRFFPYADTLDIISNFKKADNASYNATFTYPRAGAIEYIHALASYINTDTICCDEAVNSIDCENHTVTTNKRTLQYDNLISTIPFDRLLKLCKVEYDPSIYTYNKVLVFNLGFDKKGTDTTNNWLYFPSKEYVFYRVGYYDNIFSDNRMSLYVEVGYKSTDEVDVEPCKQQVIEDLKKVGIITSQNLISTHSVIMDPAYVHITSKTIKDVAAKKSLLKNSDIYSIGRYGSWTYCSIEDGMKEARDLIQTLNQK